MQLILTDSDVNSDVAKRLVKAFFEESVVATPNTVPPVVVVEPTPEPIMVTQPVATPPFDTDEPEGMRSDETFDANGIPWDARIHSDTRGLNKDGTWRKRRFIDDTYYHRIVSELRASGSAVVPDSATIAVHNEHIVEDKAASVPDRGELDCLAAEQSKDMESVVDEIKPETVGFGKVVYMVPPPPTGKVWPEQLGPYPGVDKEFEMARNWIYQQAAHGMGKAALMEVLAECGLANMQAVTPENVMSVVAIAIKKG